MDPTNPSVALPPKFQPLIFGLPNEMLLHIADSINEKRGIAALARSNRFFYELFNPVLYAKDARSGARALVFASENNRMRTAQLSLASGANPDTKQGYVLMMALKNRNTDMVRLLLDAGADPNACRWGDTSPLIWALKPKDRVLFNCPAFHAGQHQNEELLLNLDHKSSKSSLLKLMLDHESSHKLDVRTLGPGNNTALHYAAYFDFPEVAERLIELGAVIDAMDINGQTPLLHAVVNHSIATARLLLNYGAYVDVRQRDLNFTPLHRTISYGISDNKMAVLLLNSGADTMTTNGRGNTALHEAAHYGDFHTARRLLESDVAMEPLNHLDETPIQIAATRNHISVVQLLLQYDPDPVCRGIFQKLDPRDYDQPQALAFLAKKQLDGRPLAAIARAVVARGIEVWVKR